MKHDPVENPAHYQLANGLEAIDVIRAALTPGQFAGYCKGSVIKYALRAGRKDNAIQDCQKAITYLNWWIDTLKGNDNETEPKDDR